MQTAIRQPLSLRLARNTVALAILLGGLLGLLQVAIDYLDESEVFDEQLRAVIAISEVPAIQIAYNLDERLAGELLQGLIQHPAIVHAQIMDGDGKPLAQRTRPFAEASWRTLNDHLFGRERRFVQPLRAAEPPEVYLGSLVIVADTYTAGALFLERAVITLLSVFLKSLVLAAMLFIMFHLLLTKPLIKVIRASRAVDPEHPEKTRLPVPAGHEDDEIGDLVTSTNSHLSLIEVNLQRLREAEGQLKGYSEALEQQVAERTLELSDKNKALLESNKALVIAKEQAVTKARSRADFLSSMSHEIRTPFNGVLGMISLTLEDPLNDRQREQLGIAQTTGKALLNLLNDILDISKVESGKLELEHIALDLRDIVETTARLLAPNAHARQVSVFTSIEPSFPERVLGDPTRLRQIVSNLVGNAIKFTERGHVELRLAQLDEQRISIEIEDTGIGIPATQLESIFRPFTQADADTTRRFGGTGLGLTLCHQLVGKMQGTITVHSTPGTGSLFRVDLPLQASRGAPPPPAPPSGLLTTAVRLVFRAGSRQGRQIEKQFKAWGVSCGMLSYHDAHGRDAVYEARQGELLVTDLATGSTDPAAGVPTSDMPAAGVPAAGAPAVLVVLDRPAPRSQDCEGTPTTVSAPLSRQGLIESLERVLGSLAPFPATTGSLVTMREPAPTRAQLLLVEDNQVNQMVATAMLKKLGFAVSVASNGREAVEAVANATFDLILMDCHMPVMDGFEAAARIRSQARFDRIPIIALTANVMEGDKERCLYAGMNDYMTKPYDRSTLAQMLERWCPPGKTTYGGAADSLSHGVPGAAGKQEPATTAAKHTRGVTARRPGG